LKSSQQDNLPENSLIVEISDALSEKDRVKFTVHTKTTIEVIHIQLQIGFAANINQPFSSFFVELRQEGFPRRSTT
jgi:hypothetical protein